MKKIGFIYKYSPSEAMGILVYGTWKEKSMLGTTIKNTPILFSDADLLSDVSTGQLVYFDLEGDNAINIERASLSNFKLDWISNIVRCENSTLGQSFYDENTIISFEYLNDIVISEKDNCEDELDDFFYNLFDSDDFSTEWFVGKEFDLSIITEPASSLPDSIVDLYNCFGKYKHRRNDSIAIDVFDLSLWIDADIENNVFFGSTVEELKCLYDLFVMRKRYDITGNEVKVKPSDDCISSVWSLLLSKFSESQLLEILEFAPKLQPALPKTFCKKNIGFLTDEYGMPDVEICRLYCLDKISNAKTILDYKGIKHKLFVYAHCNAKHLEREGCPMCRLGKRRIANLSECLEEQYAKVIKPNVITQFSQLCKETDIVSNLSIGTSDDINNIGEFLDRCSDLENIFFGYKVCENILESYKRLPQSYKKALTPFFSSCVNSSVIAAAKDKRSSPFMLGYHIELLSDWVTDSTNRLVKELVNDRFANLDDLDELSDAFKNEYITKEQYLYKYQQVTCEYNASQLMMELSKSSGLRCKFPLNIQWYIVSRIITLLGYKDLDSFNYIRLDYGNSVSDIRSLIKWLVRQKDDGSIDIGILLEAEKKLCSTLSNDEKWALFEENIILSPGEENIRKHLEEAYNKKEFDDTILKHSCFQDAMLSDVDNISSPEVLMFIADSLDSEHQYLLQQRVSGLLKLYLWQKHPTDDFDWELIKTYYHKLSVEIQIKLMRYIFGQIASRKFPLTVDELYSTFVLTSTPASPVICAILHILIMKQKDVNISISTSMIESVIGEDRKQRFHFLKEIKELFYPCNGYIAITPNKCDIEYQSFNGVLTQEIKDDQLLYVIKFYNTPVNLFGHPIDWLDSKEIDEARQVLVRNTTVNIADEKYYIHKSLRPFVQHFVMKYKIDDRCGLISDKERMIECGYLPKHNAYQPLYTNWLRPYDDSDNYVCRCGIVSDTDPENHIPFFWCNKKICVRRAHFLLPISKWEEFRFADLIFIALGQRSEMINTVWQITGEISQFINNYVIIYKSTDRNIYSKPLNELDDKGIWSSELSTYHNIYYDCDLDEEYGEEYGCDDDYGEEYGCDDDYEDETYERYNGSYAQDEMGYSDDDIDTIFDGDPNAYWNID